MDKKEEVTNLVEALTTDIDDRMENMIAIKGQKFAEAVSMCLAIHSLLEIAGTENVPVAFRRIMLTDMAAGLMSKMLTFMLENDADRKEAIQFAKNINNTMTDQARKIGQVLKGE